MTTTRWTPKNARGATVHDIERDPRGQIRDVLYVDTRTGTVCCARRGKDKLLKRTPGGEMIARRFLRFERIWPVFAGREWPVMFQCSGRLR